AAASAGPGLGRAPESRRAPERRDTAATWPRTRRVGATHVRSAHPCSCASPPTSPGMSRPTSSRSRSSATPPADAPPAGRDGPLGELNRRAGGELAALATFGELRAKRFTSTLAAPGDVAAGRLLTVSAGDADKLDRETVLHVGAAAEHRLGGRHAKSLAIWI